MGLDVYLYHYKKPVSEALAEIEVVEELEEEADQALKKELGLTNWETASRETKDEYWRRQKERREANGLDEDGEPDVRECIEHPSAKHPDHLFKVGYFRSSYNGSGVNAVLRDRIGVELDDIFEPIGEEKYHRAVDWSACRARAAETLQKFIEFCERHGAYIVQKFAHNPLGSPYEFPRSAKAALDVFLKEEEQSKKRPGHFQDYGGMHGDFFFSQDPRHLCAVIPGTQDRFFGMKGGTEPCMFVVWRTSQNEDGSWWWHWYRDALEVVIETCDWVLAQPDPDRYLLHWSG
jgi:hypothetical protein